MNQHRPVRAWRLLLMSSLAFLIIGLAASAAAYLLGEAILTTTFGRSTKVVEAS